MKLIPPPFFFSPAGGAAVAASGDMAAGTAKIRAQNLRRASMSLCGGQRVDAPFTTRAAYALPPPLSPQTRVIHEPVHLVHGSCPGFCGALPGVRKRSAVRSVPQGRLALCGLRP